MIQFIVKEDWNTGYTKFFLMEDEGNHRIIIGQKDGHLVEYRPEPGTIPIIEPLLQMPHRWADIFLKAVANYLSNNSIKTESENHLVCKLNATEKHLEDLRSYFGRALDKVLDDKNKA